LNRIKVILIILCINLNINAQKIVLLEADELFNMGNYMTAMVKYRMYLVANKTNDYARRQIGLCYLQSNIDKTKSIKYFEECIEKAKYDKEIMFYLANAYIYNMEFDKAANALSKYELHAGKYKKLIPELRSQISVSKQLINDPVNVIISNLGKTVNTEYADYYPYIDKKEKLLVFSSRRLGSKGMPGFNGYFPADIYTSRFNGFKFGRCKAARSLNTPYDEEATGITDDGESIFVSINNYNEGERGNIFISNRKGSSYKKKEIILGSMNGKYFESSGTIAEDNEVIYFSSNRAGGMGGFDIYMIKELPNGKWGEAQNIKEINTPMDEEYPYFNSSDNKLYFSSNGLPGMGNYDLFSSKFSSISSTWSSPKNLGYPINSAYDERTICFNKDNSNAYISSVRKGGIGDFDIYKVNFTDFEPHSALYKINVISADSTIKKIENPRIELMNSYGDVIGSYMPNENSGIFTIIIHSGKYKIKVRAEGHKNILQKFNVSTFATDKEKNIITYTLIKQ